MTIEDRPVEARDATASARSRTGRVSRLPLNAIAPVSSPARAGNGDVADERANARAHTHVGQPPTQAAGQDVRKRPGVPEEIRQRFVVTRNTWYFPGREPAFVDRGHRLTTRSDNSEVIESLATIAQARGWREITVTGTEAFKHQMWLAAQRTGLLVRDYQPYPRIQAEAMRETIRRAPAAAPEARDAEFTVAPMRPAHRPMSMSMPMPMPKVQARPTRKPREWRGRLIGHGAAPYRHEAASDISYFITLQIRDREEILWGIDLKRALQTSLSRPQPGDEVVLRRWNHESGAMRRVGSAEDGQRRPGAHDIRRHRYVIETHDFFEERARLSGMVRDASVPAQLATHQHPQLAGTYLQLRVAQLVGERLVHPEDQRRFVHLVRHAMADDIARGEPMTILKLRSRAAARGTLHERPGRAAGLLRE